jgi:hypothetical protein
MRKTASLCLPILYCLVIGIYSFKPVGLNPNSLFSGTATSQKEHQFSISSSGLFCSAVQVKSSLTGSVSFSPIPFKKLFNGFSICSKASEQVWHTTFYRYVFYSKNEVIRFFQTSIIFPFHSFW